MENYKEKCEQYLERAKKEIKECGYNQGRINMIKRIFPELRESEDEQHCKWILEYLYDGLRKSDEQFKDQFKAAIAWLEKQGEQDNNEDSNILQRFSFYSYKDKPNILYLSGLYVNKECRNKGIGTKILEVADEVAKSLNCNAIRLKTKKDSNAERLYRTHGYNSLATEERDEIWLEKQGKKSDWSEEDEKKRQLLIKVLEVNHPNGHFKANPINTTNMEAMSSKELVDWLKSLKPNHWKPSEDLEEEYEKYFKAHEIDIVLNPYTNCKDIARHFAEWQKHQMKEVLQTEYEKGRFDMREEMMKDAVSGEVVYSLGTALEKQYKVTSERIKIDGLKFGDKVKIIIIKEE